MKRNHNTSLTIYTPTGTRYVSGTRTFFRIVSSPVTLFAITIAAIVAMWQFSLVWKWAFLPISTTALAVLVIFIRWKLRRKPLFSKRLIRQYNDFMYIIGFYSVEDRQLTDTDTERTKEDIDKGVELFCTLAENVCALGLYDCTGETKLTPFTGKEFEEIVLLRFFTDISLADGIGHILAEPSVELMSKMKSLCEKVIHRALRDIGLVGWKVERVELGDNVLFLLTDPTQCRAYDFAANTDMYTVLTKLAAEHDDYEIPIMPGVFYSPRSAPHALISGVTGFGKSFFLMYLIIMLSLKKSVLFLCDPKRSDLASLADFMPSERVVWESEGIFAVVEEVANIMMIRYDYMKTERQRTGKFQSDFADFGLPLVVLIIEELAAFVATLDKKRRDLFEANIKSITLQGRQAGVNLISVMQSPNANNISTESRSQMGLRAYLGKGSTEMRMLFGDGYELPQRMFKIGQGLFMIAGKTDKPEIIETPVLDKTQLPDTLKRALKKQYDVKPIPTEPLRSEAEQAVQS